MSVSASETDVFCGIQPLCGHCGLRGQDSDRPCSSNTFAMRYSSRLHTMLECASSSSMLKTKASWKKGWSKSFSTQLSCSTQMINAKCSLSSRSRQRARGAMSMRHVGWTVQPLPVVPVVFDIKPQCGWMHCSWLGQLHYSSWWDPRVCGVPSRRAQAEEQFCRR